MPDDYYVSQYSGEEIDDLLGKAGSATGAVRYDAAQTLTDAQKAQARGNIDAAPDGFGLGGSATLLTSADNLDALMKNGWYTYDRSNVPQGTLPTALASYASLIKVSAAGNTCVQEAYDPTDSNLHGTVLRRTVYGLGAGAQIYPWEWVNPPMQLGVEYRTTERYLSKPVYCKLIDFGSLPNATKKMVYFNNNSSIIISAVGITSYMVLLLGTGENEHNATLKVRNNTITIETTDNQTSYTATILVKYYKDTD